MLNKKTARTIILLSAVFITSACAAKGPEAYVYLPGEFNRDAENFGKDPEDIFTVTVCYNVFGTKPEEIVNMAQTECGKFNKKAKFKNQVYNICPLFTPIGAYYVCTGETSEKNHPLKKTPSNTDPYYPNFGKINPNYKNRTPERRLP